MTLATWLSLLTVCTLGAMSPGPSVAVIMQITRRQGRSQGVVAAIGHGCGIACYALLAAMGLAVVISQSPLIFNILQYMGAAFLVYLGLGALGIKLPSLAGQSEPSAHGAASDSRKIDVTTTTSITKSFITGLLTALLNPKVALFFLALFSQFVRGDAQLSEKIIMALTASIVDGLWYSFIAVAVSHPRLANSMQTRGAIIEKVFGLLLIAVAIAIVW